MQMQNIDVFERYNLYILPEKFFIEPRDRDGGLASTRYIEIDRISTNIRVRDQNEERIRVADAEIKLIYGVVGTIQLVAGPSLIVINRAKQVGSIMGHDVWQMEGAEVIPYRRTTAHLTDKQALHERHFQDLLTLVLLQPGFYFCYSFDLTRSLQWLSENANPEFRKLSLIERADPRFVWNGYLLSQLRSIRDAVQFCLPLMHGFYGSRRVRIGGHICWLTLISRRSIQSAGVRFHKRGVNAEGQPANFVETEQIVHPDGDTNALASFVQLRGSIPLFWSQKPNLRWQPCPMLKPADDQLQAYVKHFESQRQLYGGNHVIVNLVNQKGRENKVGGELERISLQANLQYVRHHGFDFHRECGAMQWERLSILKNQLTKEIASFGFFATSSLNPSINQTQLGYFRSNCMDCLDRTNVVQSMLARAVLPLQLGALGFVSPQSFEVVSNADLEEAFKNLWADNGDQCSKQYAGTGALKSDYTRLGKRTYVGALNDGVNAITRYFRNNFADGNRQDAIDLFLGNFRVDVTNLPTNFDATLLALNQQGVAILAAAVAMSMTVLCILVAENYSATFFWLCVFGLCMAFIVLNGEDFVNSPKLKKD
ncbi:unnamed protein product, partial [Mesorhabditis belari]|uniref:Phosphatidylinositol-3-phosphatase SAC1 n=1 Tax=Mesorhabditis belari TaxID=2138241 RepID=A0AAF3J7V3_9BILA